jgi:diguanylate cyclase (GGDEF)-like protein
MAVLSDRRLDPRTGEERPSEIAPKEVALSQPAAAPRPTSCAFPRQFQAAPTRPRDRFVLFVIQGHQQGAVISLNSPRLVVGREARSNVCLDDDTVSREHATLTVVDGRVLIEDLGSLNGTFINEQRVLIPTQVNDGDQLRFGDHTIVKFWVLDEVEQRALETLYELTSRDPLTRLYNRRYFDERLASELSFARRHRTSLGLLMIDLDHFKSVNDTYGHPVGDAVLKAVGASLLEVTRPEDIVARYGGEEFVLVARNTSRANAVVLADRVRRVVQGTRIPEQPLEVTVSICVVCVGPSVFPDRAEDLLVAADEALYQAKELGRNRVCVAKPVSGSGAPPVGVETIPPGAFHRQARS